MSTPFSYHLYHRPTNRHYYGIRFARGCHPNQLWTTYFSSSKVIKKLIEEYGTDSFEVSVRRTFHTANAALTWEHKVLRRLGAAQRSDWINRHNGGTSFRAPQHHTKKVRQMLLEYAKRPKSEEWKAKARERMMINNAKRTAEGWKMPVDDVRRRAEAKRGIARDPDIVRRMRASKTGKKKLILSCGKFVFV